jgi:DNA-binding MltR family transcriptional regulator
MKIENKKEVERYFEINSRLMSFNNQFNFENNERAIVIVGLAYIDDLLLYCLENYFPENSSTVKNILSFRGILGTFNSKVDILYSLGFIDKIVKNDLVKLGEIRNLFAHQIDINFQDESIIKVCKLFEWHKISMMMETPNGANSLEIFKVEVNTIISHLSGIASMCKLEKRKLK